MVRELSARQLRFATLLASGKKSIVGAFRETYEPANPKAPHVFRNSFRLSRHPGVREKIRELQIGMFPSIDDAEAIQQHAVAVVFHLSIGSKSERVRLRAAEMLFELSEKLQAARDAAPQHQGRALTELRRIYDRMTALADREEPASSSPIK
jgi:hypothetical protein